MTEVSFGEWLKRRRKAVGWTQEQLALKINCSTSALRKMEAELRRPSGEVVERLAEIFDIPQEEYKSFLRFARGDSGAFASGDVEEAPWRVSSAPVAPRSNLPVSITSFIGREKEQDEIAELIAQNRLVTLTGAGGIGKTRLSIQTAFALLGDFPNGIWLVELAPVSDPVLVAQVVVTTLGLIEQANRSPFNIVLDFLQKKRALLILDNCEHLIQACAQLAESLLRACPDLHILATSREALDIAGETLYFVPSLSIPESTHVALDGFSDYEAVQLFIERAQSAMRDFSLTQDNADAIAQVCYHLDGIPLALELAAARVKLLRVDEIAARLDDRFRLLTGGVRTALPRHQTLQGMIDWSHDLLSEPERVLLRRLSVFAGGWTLEAAEAVCTDLTPTPSPSGRGESAPPSLSGKGAGGLGQNILDLLTSLVNKSLVIAEREQGKETRYHMLETIRQYARDKLWAAGEGELIRQRHLEYFVDLAERAEPNLRAFDMVMWMDRLEAELDNIRVALEWALESDIEAQLRLASALLWFWHIRGHKNEGIDWLERGLSIEAVERGDQPPTPSRAMIRGKALNASGSLLGISFENRKALVRLEESLALFDELGPVGKQGMAYALLRLGGLPSANNQEGRLIGQSLNLFRELRDKFGIAECLMQLAGNAQKDGDYENAVIFAEQQLDLRREIGDQDGIASSLGDLGDLAFGKGDHQRAAALLEESLARFRVLRNKWAVGFILLAYGDGCLLQGDYERATKIYEEAFAFAENLGDRFLTALNLYNLGVTAWFRGDYVGATQRITDSLPVFRDMGHHWPVASSLHALGDIALAQDNDEKASQWYEAELDVGRETHIKMIYIFALSGLGKVAWAKGSYELAAKRFEEALRMSRDLGIKPVMFYALYGLGRVAQSRGEYATARTFYAEALSIQPQRISPQFKWLWLKTYFAPAAFPLEAFALLSAAQNKMQRAARLFGAVETLYPPLRFEISARERAEHDQAIAAARAALGEEAFAAAWEEGKKMTLEQAIEYALRENY